MLLSLFLVMVLLVLASQQAIPVTAANGGKVIIKDGTYLCKDKCNASMLPG